MAGNVKPLFDGLKTGAGTVEMDGYLFGGCDLNTDGSNVGTVEVREDSASGKLLLHTKSAVGKTPVAPFKSQSKTIYYNISGTGADAMLYEWVR